MAMNGVAICWPEDSRRIGTLAREGVVPSFCRALQATLPGSPLALVSPSGRVQLSCTLSRCDGPTPVVIASGKRVRRGWKLVAQPDSVRVGEEVIPKRLPFKWRQVGQLRYFDPRTMRPIVVFGPQPGGTFLSGYGRDGSIQLLPTTPYRGGIPGLPRQHPEAALVTKYVDWIGSADRFLHAQPLKHGGYTDLFNLTTWTLFEAKASVEDRAIRQAFGQLHDYRRSFCRSPQVAVLLPVRPSRRILEFLAYFGVAAVWATSKGFSDSVAGKLSRDLRRRYARTR